MALRRSTRQRFPTQKVKDNQSDSSNPITTTPSVPVNLTPSRVTLKEAPLHPSNEKLSHTLVHRSPASPPPVNNEDTNPVTVATQTTLQQQFHLNSLMTHLKFACKNYQSLAHMSRTGSLSNMPLVRCPSRECPACLLVKGAKLRRNLTTSLANLRPGQLLMIDFAFFNVQSLRGYKSYLSITCQATGCTFTYPTHRMRAPVDIIK